MERAPPVDGEHPLDRGIVEVLEPHERLDDAGTWIVLSTTPWRDAASAGRPSTAPLPDVHDVRRDRLAGRSEACGLIERGTVVIDRRDPRAPRDRLEGDGAADAAARSRDHQDLIGHLHDNLASRVR